MAGAKGFLLNGDFGGRDGFFDAVHGRRGDDHDLLGREHGDAAQQVIDHGTTAQLMHHLGLVRFHACAGPGCEDNGGNA